jgi:hypothetical protein
VNMIIMLCTLVGVISTPLCIRDLNYFAAFNTLL